MLPLGAVIRISGAGPYSGTYVVTDTGSKVVGHHIDIFLNSTNEARRFGKKMVVVRLLRPGDNNRGDHSEVTPPAPQG